jgi:PAS domain S-box-containing protein
MSEQSKVLIVDDDLMNLKYLTLLLENDYIVKTVTSGREALSVLNDFIPELIILDVIMPGIDGYEVCHKIKNIPILKTTKILILSSKEVIEDKLKGYEVGADDFIVKPFDSSELLAKVKVFLRLKTEEDKRRKTEEELKSSELKYRTLYTQANDSILLLNQSIIEDCNNRTLDLFKCKTEEIVNTSFLSYSTKYQYDKKESELIFSDKIKNAIDSKCCTFKWLCKKKDGSLFDAELKINQIEIEDKKCLQVIIKDISKQKQTEDALKKARDIAEKANNMRTEFLANMSHELRTPLHGILSFSQFGIKKINSAGNDKLLGYFNRINSSGKKLLEILNDILDMARMESGKTSYSFEKNDLKFIVDSALFELESVTSEKEIQISVMKPDFDIVVECDKLRIEQVIKNIICNAVKYSHKQKKIEISLEKKVLNNQKCVIVKVKDNGIGIPTNELNLIFEKFTQGSKTNNGAGGTGLGLAICSEIITRHQGKIWVEPNQDVGAVFYFYIPEMQNTK